ncbi:hypothetical protein DCAR_0416989 [Daucus carota subsp. sativus]|uniref:Fungal lipase-like domain-containing protein n=1 Tax=Daucus carota subsp. sativus TaxID=79200 RepID=A0AAF1AW59_DAUCS|nr:hypothetical protein DCAR_0416989 [Daucus carota subsp. sativus]
MNQFNHEEELGNLLICSDLISNCWAHIMKVNEETPKEVNSSLLPQTVKYKRFEFFDARNSTDVTIIAFSCSMISSDLRGEGQRLVSSADLNLELFDFLSTNSNPSFSLHNLAIQLFHSLLAQLIQEKINTTKPLIITGHSLGGSVASLFTIWLLNNSYKKIEYRKTKFPICLTFGSPLLGNEGLQKAISGRPSWDSCFVHVVSTQDPVPGLFLSPHNTIDSESCFESKYKSFGLYLFCSESRFACISKPELVLELLWAFSSKNLPFNDYGLLLKGVKSKAIVRGIDLVECDNNPFRTGITLQLQAIGIHDTLNKDLIGRIVTKQKESLERKAYEVGLDESLKKMKIEMTYMEWYKKTTRTRGGYYDTYKSSARSRNESVTKAVLVKHQRSLTKCWANAVYEERRTDAKSFTFCLLMAGNNYRRMVEPLDIAEYYKGYCQKDYWAGGRSEHYILLEKWLNEMQITPSQRTKNCSFNVDSCFWAHVEEALILVKMLSTEESSPENEELFRKLNNFEEYVMDSIAKRIVDPEIFLEGSSFQLWWSLYSDKKGDSCKSPLANYMRARSYEALL